MINITIHITGEELGEVERAVLAALAGTTGEYVVNPPEKDIAEYKPEAKRTRRTKAEMEAARAAEEAAVKADADLVVADPAEAAEPEAPPVKETVHAVPNATLDDAVKLATELVAANRTADIKQALGDIGAKRVSELKGEQIGVFIGKFAA